MLSSILAFLKNTTAPISIKITPISTYLKFIRPLIRPLKRKKPCKRSVYKASGASPVVPPGLEPGTVTPYNPTI